MKNLEGVKNNLEQVFKDHNVQKDLRIKKLQCIYVLSVNIYKILKRK